MYRNIFQRPFRMTHYFEQGAQAAALDEEVFDFPHPKRPDERRSRAVTSRTDGSNIQEGLSPVIKPNGKMASRSPDAMRIGDALGSGAGMVLVARRERK